MNINRIVEGLMRSGVGGGLAGGLASGLLVQSLGSKKGRKMAGQAVKLGGAALIGGLAWNAYQQYRQRNAAGAGPEGAVFEAKPEQGAGTAAHGSLQDSPMAVAPRRWNGPDWQRLDREQFQPTATPRENVRDLLVLRAMIAAAHADGHMDRNERTRIYQQLESLELDAEERGLIVEELLTPLTLQQLLDQVPDPALGAEVYLAAAVTLDQTHDAAREFLAGLAAGLRLPPELLQLLDAQARQALPGVPADTANRNGLSQAITASPSA